MALSGEPDNVDARSDVKASEDDTFDIKLTTTSNSVIAPKPGELVLEASARLAGVLVPSERAVPKSPAPTRFAFAERRRGDGVA